MLGFLNAYRLEEKPPQYQLDYAPMMMAFLNSSFPEEKVHIYNVALGDFPEDIRECEKWIIGGSPKGAYDPDDWIKKLGSFIRECQIGKVKMAGICFGHQMIAHFLGGKTQKSKKGWGVGVQQVEITGHSHWMEPELKSVSLLFSHQDQVSKLPEGAQLLAQNDFCPYQMYSIGDQFLGIQGHPEFTVPFMMGRLDSRKDILGESYNRAVVSLTQQTHSKEVGVWLRKFLAEG